MTNGMEFMIQNAMQTQQPEQQGNVVGQAKIRVIGCGGGGCNATNWLFQKGVKGAEVIALNTDKQHLEMINADHKILVGEELTRGLGAGGNPTIGEKAARETITELKGVLNGTDMTFICVGLGGGTGTGVAPVVAETCKSMGSIAIGCATMPFKIERARIDKAELGLQKLRTHCDTVVVIDNNELVRIAGSLPVAEAFAVANEIISTMIKGIVEIISVPSLVNLDYADVKAIMKDSGVATVGIGFSDTNNRVQEAVSAALENPLLKVDYSGATGALIHVTGGRDLTLDEVTKAGELVTQGMDDTSTVIWGARIDESMQGRMSVMVVMTGVKSPWVLGKLTERELQQQRDAWANDLGIRTI